MNCVRWNGVSVSRLLLGGNPFSGFSHQGPERDREMLRYYTVERIKATLREAEACGITGLVARSDRHIIRTLLEHRDEGGAIQWFAQTAPEIAFRTTVSDAKEAGAVACHLHGGVSDFLFAQRRTGEIQDSVAYIRDRGLLAGIAGHNPQVFVWAEEAGLPVDYYMCSYYNPSARDRCPEHVSGVAEWFREEDRRTMTGVIQRLSRPVIHYKVLAAGRNDPVEAFRTVAASMRSQDAVCVGVFTKYAPGMIRADVELLEDALARLRKGA